MPPESALHIRDTLTIPEAELQFRFSRSGGPGGQHVNRVATQVELLFDVLHSPSLDEAQRGQVQAALPSYIDSRGVLHLTSRTTRSQYRNRVEVTARLQRLLQHALRPQKPRRPTRPSAAVTERRLEAKRRLSRIKQARRRRWPVSE